jgi:quercetin dioxygenase-like cupin family protein
MTHHTENPSDSTDAHLTEELAVAMRPAPIEAEARARMWSKVTTLVAEVPPAGTSTSRASEDGWRDVSPLIKCRPLRVDPVAGIQIVLIRAQPGACIPRHRHSQDEEFIVLEGECHIGTHHLRAGDAHFAAAGSWHDDITTSTGILVLVRGEYPAPAHS